MNKITMLGLSLAISCLSLNAMADEKNTLTTPADTKTAQKVDKKGVKASKQLKDYAPYPEAAKGQERFVIFLKPHKNEENLKIELLVGKTIEVDCNRHSFGGNLEEKTLQGWGYTYYEIGELKGPMSTMMACPGYKKYNEFVSIANRPLMRYNSKLPIVVYAPEGTEVKYRLWVTTKQAKAAVKQ